MPASNIQRAAIKAPVLEFDDEIFQVDASTLPKDQWMDFACMVYSMPGRGKSSFLRSFVEDWGPESITAMDIEKRLHQIGVPRVVPPDFSQWSDTEHYARIFAWWDMVLDRAEKRAQPFNPQSRVIAIDTINTLYDMIYDADLVRHYAGKDVPREKWMYNFTWYKGLYDDFLKRFRRMVRLTKVDGYTIILNCHVALKHRTVDGNEIDQYEPQLPPVLQNVLNREVHTIFYLKAADGSIPNYFITAANDGWPAKDQTGRFPRNIWPRAKALEAAMTGQDPKPWMPTNLRLVAKKEEKK